MFLKTKISLLLGVVSIILVSLKGIEGSTRIFAQDAAGNVVDSTRAEGAIVEEQSHVTIHFCDLYSEQGKSSHNGYKI